MCKYVLLPYWQASAGILEFDLASLKKDSDKLLIMGLVPAYQQVLRATARIHRRAALLRYVEAIRIFSFENDGQLPKDLAAIKLPLPLDPVHGKAFGYSIEGKTAVLTGPPPSWDKTPYSNVRYLVSIAKPPK